ncbi:MAG: hypothetical protein MJZ22_03360 [Candidatus Saccharibacteria bacterium]|nr:hypothetical protein [Candidatus Saccharibacteria bacterium]
MPINNFEIIRNFLHFELDGDIYFAEVIARGKDEGKSGKRLIRDFHIHSLEHFDKLKPEIIDLCDHYGARCYLRLNQRNMDELNSYLKIKLEEQEILRKQSLRKFIRTGCDKNRIEKLPKVVSASKLFASVMGTYSSEPRESRKWTIDVDMDDSGRTLDEIAATYEDAVLKCNGKIYARIPSRTGMHLVISPINKESYAQIMGSASTIITDGITNLYIGD